MQNRLSPAFNSRRTMNDRTDNQISAADHDMLPIEAEGQPAYPVMPAYPPQPSLARTFLRGIGWIILSAMILSAIVLSFGWWTLNNAARDILNLDTETTIISGAPVIESIKRVNKQIFVEHYNVVDIDYSQAPEGWLSVLPIEQSFVVLLRGRVPAGFDLSQISEDDLWISSDGTKVQLLLPPPTIFRENVNVDFEQSRILIQRDTCPNFLCEETVQAYKNEIIPQGRDLLIQASLKNGIFTQVTESGTLYYENFLRSLGFEEVRVLVKDSNE